MMADPQPLSGRRVGSFAYLTIKDRLPVILTKVIDFLCREKVSIGKQYGEAAQEGCKEVIGRLSQLKNEMQTNKPFRILQADPSASPHDDSDEYNRELEKFTIENEEQPKWFTAPWLYAECYMYARIHEAFYLCDPLRGFDPFLVQKQKALVDSKGAVDCLSKRVMTACNSVSNFTQQLLKQYVIQLLEVCLWGNRCDLSISGGADRAQESDIFSSLDKMRPQILDNNADLLWQLLVSLPEDQRDLVLVLDNAGFELVSDLCFLTFLMESALATSVTIHTKTRPWFVSDTLHSDLMWTIEKLREFGDSNAEMANKWANYLSSGQWKISENKFWTQHHDFASMNEVDPRLYSELCKASLVIFKGDLNYRKLTGDLDWPTNSSFQRALRGFSPAPILVLRTAKGGPVVGLAPGVAERTAAVASDWNISGDYGLIQLCTGS
ncbi:damage-control phosphatase ARMT1-like [Penaeus indicus]|uniref:damage-control phosphatase ARMT1-like n=1 Tax=Penaeus indicus TaxID=29960 RepID=UPI00300C10F2